MLHCVVNSPSQYFQFSPVEDTLVSVTHKLLQLTLMTFNTIGSSSGLQLHTRNGKINLKFSTSNSLLSYEPKQDITTTIMHAHMYAYTTHTHIHFYTVKSILTYVANNVNTVADYYKLKD